MGDTRDVSDGVPQAAADGADTAPACDGDLLGRAETAPDDVDAGEVPDTNASDPVTHVREARGDDTRVDAIGTAPDMPAGGGGPPRRRAEPRVAASFRVSFTNLDELVEAYTVDVSRGGLYVETDRFLPLGAVVRLHLALPSGGPELLAVARVAYVLDPDASKGHDRPPGMGMEFLDVGGTPLADDIARFVARVNPDVELPPPPAGMSAHVLVVDDDIWHRERAATVMREIGFDVTTAENGVRALQSAMQVEPDLILSDVEMPIMDGWQLVRMLRARPTLASIPVVYVTSLSNDEQRLQGFRLGVDDYISKPFDEDELALRVQRVLTRARAYPRNTTRSKALRGSLSHVSLSTLLAFCEVEARTGLLLLVRSDAIATIYLRDGTVVRVDLPDEADDLLGAERLHYLLAWEDGRFELADADVADDDTIGERTSAVLLQHAERKAEGR